MSIQTISDIADNLGCLLQGLCQMGPCDVIDSLSSVYHLWAKVLLTIDLPFPSQYNHRKGLLLDIE